MSDLEVILRVALLVTVPEILIYIALPFISGYAAYKAFVGMMRGGKPWEIGVPGIGGALVLLAQALYGLEHGQGQSNWDMACFLFGWMLMLLPKLWGMARAHDGLRVKGDL